MSVSLCNVSNCSLLNWITFCCLALWISWLILFWYLSMSSIILCSSFSMNGTSICTMLVKFFESWPMYRINEDERQDGFMKSWYSYTWKAKYHLKLLLNKIKISWTIEWLLIIFRICYLFHRSYLSADEINNKLSTSGLNNSKQWPIDSSMFCNSNISVWCLSLYSMKTNLHSIKCSCCWNNNRLHFFRHFPDFW